MASWFIPALKAVLPHVGDIVSAAKPIFTKKRGNESAAPSLLERQIVELQAATAQSDAHIKELAEQLRSVVAAMEEAAAAAERRWKIAIALGATALAAACVTAAFLALLPH